MRNNIIKSLPLVALLSFALILSAGTSLATQQNNNNQDPHLTNLGPDNGCIGQTITVHARLMQDDEALAGKIVNFTLGSQKASGITNSTGYATATLTVPDENDLELKATYEYTKNREKETVEEDKDFRKTLCRQRVPEFPSLALPIAAVIGMVFLLSKKQRK